MQSYLDENIHRKFLAKRSAVTLRHIWLLFPAVNHQKAEPDGHCVYWQIRSYLGLIFVIHNFAQTQATRGLARVNKIRRVSTDSGYFWGRFSSSTTRLGGSIFNNLKTLWVLATARAVVSCDTGPMHLAVALRKNVVALFGPSDPRRTGPFRGEVIRKPLDCSPCNLRECKDPACMKAITHEDVMERIGKLLVGPAKKFG